MAQPFVRLFFIACLLYSPIGRGAPEGTELGEWRYWGGDERSSRYSPLDLINRNNFDDLEIAWRWKSDNFGPSPDYIYRATPLYIKGRLYTVAGQRRTVVAIEPETGETLWIWRMPENPRWQANYDVVRRVFEEDFKIGESIQAGLSSGANAYFTIGQIENGIQLAKRAIADALKGELTVKGQPEERASRV